MCDALKIVAVTIWVLCGSTGQAQQASSVEALREEVRAHFMVGDWAAGLDAAEAIRADIGDAELSRDDFRLLMLGYSEMRHTGSDGPWLVRQVEVAEAMAVRWPDDRDALRLLRSLYAEQGRDDDAVDVSLIMARRGLAMTAGERVMAAQWLSHLGRFDEAADLLQASWSDGQVSRSSDNLALLARLQWLAGREQAALEHAAIVADARGLETWSPQQAASVMPFTELAIMHPPRASVEACRAKVDDLLVIAREMGGPGDVQIVLLDGCRFYFQSDGQPIAQPDRAGFSRAENTRVSPY